MRFLRTTCALALAASVAATVPGVTGAGSFTSDAQSVATASNVARALPHVVGPRSYAGASTASAWVKTYDGVTGTNTLTRSVLTPDGADQYSIWKASGRIQMAAPVTNVGGNRREVFVPAGSAAVLNSRSCATWTVDSTFGSNRILQQGLAVRVVSASGRTRAITVTKNVWANVGWVFNAHTWDTNRGAEPFVGLGQWDMAHLVLNGSTYKPLPWRACIQVLDQVLMFKLWVPAAQSEPSWSDSNNVRTTLIPSEFVYAGQSGWYMGHIPPGGWAEYSTLETWSYA